MYTYQKMKRMFLKKIFELVLQSALDMAPIMSLTRLPENEGKLNFVNNSVALQESFSGNNWKLYFQHLFNVSCANELKELLKVDNWQQA